MTLTVFDSVGNDDLARVFMGRTDDGAMIEFVESVQPPVPREKKWVLIVSTLKGCPVGCPICDAGGDYKGKLSKEEILFQIDYLIRRRFPDGNVPASMTKIQFARMGDPAFNEDVLKALNQLPERFRAGRLMPSISTVAPKGCEKFICRLKEVKDRLYSGGYFQMQFSVHTTDDRKREELVPVKTLSLMELSRRGESFFQKGDRKITLNFAAVKGYPVEPEAVASIFDPEKFIIKLTPVNPTVSSVKSRKVGMITPFEKESWEELEHRFKSSGFEVIISIGELEENNIGSNCGMYVKRAGMKEVG